MPSVKMPKKSTDTDMTPFVDVAFILLTFFIMATKFKPPEPLTITTPQSVSASKLEEKDALMISFDSAGRVFLNVNLVKDEDKDLKRDFIERVNNEAKLGLGEAEIQKFVNNSVIGSPLTDLKAVMSRPASEWDKIRQKGIPVDSANNELARWMGAARQSFGARQIDIMIKGDNNARYPDFKGVIEALRTNEMFKYKLITDPRGVPVGTELYKIRQAGGGQESDS
ncbi:MAG TPA: biopolymer transporter ExbD [Flavisolibacter sp.]|jgi:biopolymer transport protein ExbD|nr:biopolymer transporter ExbD [Flavisolibacter sp.]